MPDNSNSYMKAFNLYFVLIVSIFLSAGITACQNNEPETKSEPVVSGAPEIQPGNTKLADMLLSLNMHHFKETVKAPEFELSSVNDGMVSLSRYRGNVVLLSFWATW